MTDEPIPAPATPPMDLVPSSRAPLAIPEEQKPLEPLTVAHRALSGRYPWATVAALALAAIGVYLGFSLPAPLYKSVGLIDVAPKVPRVLYDSEEKGLLPMFDAYVATQARLAGQRRVIDMAMASPAWRKLGRGLSDEAVAAFRESLEITHPKYTQHVEVSFVDRDPDAAMTAVNEVIAAYMKLVDERETLSGTSRISVLESTKSLSNSKLKDLIRQSQTVTEDLGEDALAARHRAGIDELNRLDKMLNELDVEIATLIASAEALKTAPRRAPTEQEIALRDATMNQMLTERADLESRIAILSRDYGDANVDLFSARQRLGALNKRIESHAAAVRASSAEAPDMKLAELHEKQERRKQLAVVRDNVFEDTRKLGRKVGELGHIAQERVIQTEQLDDVKRRMDEITIESGLQGRITVVSYGDRPVEPDTDRRIPLAVLGAGSGLALGFGTFLLWGLREGKLRHVVDVDRGAAHGRFLGVLPDVPDPYSGDGGGESADMSDFCVHHIRTMLQLRRRRDARGAAFAISSPMPGAGKTTLALALGTSFAAAGSRTLLVDCDFVGRGLTYSVRALLCDILRRALPGEDPQPSASGPERRIGGRGIMSGIVASRMTALGDADVAEVIEVARERAAEGDEVAARVGPALEHLLPHPAGHAGKPRGVIAALDGADLARCVVHSGVRNMDLLAATDASADDGDCLASEPFEQLLAACRDAYDVVVIDTGPMLGSIEAAVAAAATDAVVLVVARGDRRPAVDEALARAEGIGADVAGVVFNRASPKDIAKSNHASRSSPYVTGAA